MIRIRKGFYLFKYRGCDRGLKQRIPSLIAQRIEHLTFNQGAFGSIPNGATKQYDMYKPEVKIIEPTAHPTIKRSDRICLRFKIEVPGEVFCMDFSLPKCRLEDVRRLTKTANRLVLVFMAQLPRRVKVAMKKHSAALKTGM